MSFLRFPLNAGNKPRAVEPWTFKKASCGLYANSTNSILSLIVQLSSLPKAFGGKCLFQIVIQQSLSRKQNLPKAGMLGDAQGMLGDAQDVRRRP